jgi:hypothetical protein
MRLSSGNIGPEGKMLLLETEVRRQMKEGMLEVKKSVIETMMVCCGNRSINPAEAGQDFSPWSLLS